MGSLFFRSSDMLSPLFMPLCGKNYCNESITYLPHPVNLDVNITLIFCKTFDRAAKSEKSYPQKRVSAAKKDPPPEGEGSVLGVLRSDRKLFDL